MRAVCETVEVEHAGSRRFRSGPFDVGHAMLTTPMCSMRAQGAPDSYATTPTKTITSGRTKRALDVRVGLDRQQVSSGATNLLAAPHPEQRHRSPKLRAEQLERAVDPAFAARHQSVEVG